VQIGPRVLIFQAYPANPAMLHPLHCSRIYYG
jgi:hypothetical protein